MAPRHGYHESLETPFPHTTVVLLVRDEGSRGGCVWEWDFEDRHLSLYIRVESTFYTHRKTMRLKAIIGESAFWVPPRLWAYAAGHQPDGCFKDYSAEEIAMLICYPGDAKVMLEALLQAGFMDNQPLRVHDWHEYNGVLDFFSKRAKKAAEARWEKERSKEKDQIQADQSKAKQSRSEASIASSIPSASPPVSSEHQAFAKGWTENFKAQFGAEYQFDRGRDGKAVQELLRMSIARLDLLEIAKKAWARGLKVKSFNCEKASTIHGFRQYFNDIQVEVKHGHTHQQNNRRLTGVSQNNAVNDYAKAAQRKLELQVAASENGQTPKAEGTGT